MKSERRPPLTYDLLLSQGRIADRTPGAIRGAALTARAITGLTGLQPSTSGTPSEAKQDDWSTSLPEASETLAGLQAAVSASLKAGHKPLVVANTCSASLATLPAVALARPDAKVLWIDAHGDFNTPETTDSGYLGGMALAGACGLWESGHGHGLKPSQVILIGATDLDPVEADLLKEHGVHTIPAREATPEAILHALDGSPVWIHIDWDVLEPGFVPAAYAVAGGLLPQQLEAILSGLPPATIIGIELAEFEAGEDSARNEQALSVIMSTVQSLLLK